MPVILLRKQRAGGLWFEASPDKEFHKKRAGGMAQGVDPEFKPQYRARTHTHTHTHRE
jgi:hypothetical protein